MSRNSEDARLSSAGPLEVTLYTRPGCHLCEEAKALMQPLLRQFCATLREVNIEEDQELARRYGMDIPVIFIGAHKAAKHRVDPQQFRRQLEEARSRA
jgi:glutaredoxin